REEILKDRLGAIQKNGGNVKYLEVIMESQDFGDFISRSSAVNTIMDQDQSIMDELNADKKELEKKKKEVETKQKQVKDKKKALESQKEELKELESQLDDQIAKKEKVMDQLEEDQEQLEAYKVSLEDEQEILAKQKDAVKEAKQMAESDKDELEKEAREKAAREKAEIEKAEQEQAEQENQDSNQEEQDNKQQEEASTEQKSVSAGSTKSSSPDDSSSGTSSDSNSDKSSIPEPSGAAKFSYPTSVGITAGYVHRWGSLHACVDFGVGVGTPVSAAASGVVVSTNTENDGQMNGYGNVVLVAHSINGTTYTTLYAHLSSISVSAGDKVSRGQTIGASGNTGQSTGPHLHFEIHKGGWNASKSNSVNPLSSGYLN